MRDQLDGIPLDTVVNKSLRHLLLVVVLALAALPGLSRAASGDYVSLQVPDVPQAIGFFHDVMNCDVIAQSTTGNLTRSAMLDCGDGNTVELTGGAVAHQRVISFVTDDATAASAWLRAKHVRVLAQPVHVAAGSNRDNVVVDFVTPWGQPLRLVSHARADELSATRLAVQ
jgi:hypothetical protein